MDDKEIITEEKIILPINLQKEMMSFFLKTSMPKIIAAKVQQQTSPNLKDEAKGEASG